MEAQHHSIAEPQRPPKKAACTIHYTVVDSPLGAILLGGGAAGLTLINFQEGRGAMPADSAWRADAAPLAEAARQLAAYFAGELREFDLALAPEGTPFQLRVWEELRRIPYGQTSTYGRLAGNLGQPTAARAVGAANGRNPLPIVVPCHRVIGGNGELIGFYGGLHLKDALLRHEERFAPPAVQQLTLL